MEATTIVLPSSPAEARRPSPPFLAAIVPVVAGVVLWLVTGSLFALAFAALGPLMVLASFLDGIRIQRRDRKRASTEADAAWARAEQEREHLHAEEHAARWRREPDVAMCLRHPPLRDGAAPTRKSALVLGRGDVVSRVQARGGEDARSRAFRERALRLEDAPITVPLGGGVCIRAAQPVAQAVLRALVAQLCLRFGPGQLRLTGNGLDESGLALFPHVKRHTQAGFRVAVGECDEPVDAVLCIRAPGEEPPEGVTTVLDCTHPLHAQARTSTGDTELSVEALSAAQAALIAVGLADRVGAESALPDRVDLGELTSEHGPGLRAAVGRGERTEVTVDLVEDGPHAIVTGMTGTGKSELLTTWVTSLAAAHSPTELAFVLVDFKGGTAFEPLRPLPHVVAIVTDLDAMGARRGVGSLSAELRRREQALTSAGVRDVADCAALGRLVIVVDEFAALLQEHPDLGEIFTDVAARGRALGMHLVLGTQRASGSIRDALAANCPLRVSLRVAEAADSRFVIGSDAAADLPGGPESRGLAFVRRPHDRHPRLTRIALTSPEDLEQVRQRWLGEAAQPSPWLPPLPDRLEPPSAGAESTLRSSRGQVAVIGLADEPEAQRQSWVRLGERDGLALLGGAGSGKSAALAALASQLPGAVQVPADPEAAWDAVAELAAGGHVPVLCDDLDALTAAYPPDYAQLFLSRWESILRAPTATVITLSRVTGPVGRLVEGMPRRALLRLSSKVDHIAAGGEPTSFQRERPTARAWLDGREVQLCTLDPQHPRADRAAQEPATPWAPFEGSVGVVTTSVRGTVSLLAQAHPNRAVIALDEALASSGASGALIVGDPEQWRAQWSMLQRVRTAGELLVAAESAAELRQLAGVRELPPFARMHADRAWSVRPGHPPKRVLLA